MKRKKIIAIVAIIAVLAIVMSLAISNAGKTKAVVKTDSIASEFNAGKDGIALVEPKKNIIGDVPVSTAEVTDTVGDSVTDIADNTVSQEEDAAAQEEETTVDVEGLVGSGYWTRGMPGVAWTITQYSDYSGSQGGFYTIRNDANGALIVIDGGWAENAEHVRSVINSLGGNVDLWIQTHYHADHVGALNSILQDAQGIKIAKIICPNLDYNLLLSVAKYWDNPECYETFLNLTSENGNVYHPSIGESMQFENLNIKFYNNQDGNISKDIPNNCSLVFKVSAASQSMLFVGDFYDSDIGSWMTETYGNELKSTYMQGCHHGNSTMPNSFYEFVNPTALFFDSPQWLIEDENYRAKDLKAWCDENGVETYSYTTAPNAVVIS